MLPKFPILGSENAYIQWKSLFEQGIIGENRFSNDVLASS
jgi:hypothetical protein